ncbi:monocarboxylate transporter 8-like isoform X5 [Xenia sp. Carnegie-2017]|uniref:monocarboxylate transporter 8-like isoform X5 n=1 Tax=Xenia sp. Carnegie-2017 TaxID=2897299 RepID=UPI001F04FFB2|nr:monocarboxylate transporter 8-like isoform X5 [Xenia sp. Carnegie-2017]
MEGNKSYRFLMNTVTFSGRVKDSKASWMFLSVSCFVILMTIGTLDSFTVLVIVFMDHYEASKAKIGWLGSIAFSLVSISYPVVVFLGRRFGSQGVLIISGILITTSYIVTPFMPSVNYLYFTYCFGVGFAASCVDCLSVVILPEFFDKHLGLATGIRLSSIAAASILFNFMVPIFVVEIGWQKLFYCFSSVGLLLIMYSFLFRIKHPVHDVPSNEVEEKETYSVCGEKLTIKERILHDRGFQLIVFGCVPYLFAILVPAMFMVAYAKSLGYPLSQSKWLIVARGIGSLAGRLAMGYIGDFATKRRIIVHIACAIVAIFGLACGLCSFTKYLPLMILFMAFTVGIGFLTGPSLMGKSQVYDATGNFRDVLYILCACGVLSAITVAMGIHVRARKTIERKTSFAEKGTIEMSKEKNFDHLSLSMDKQPTKTAILDDMRIANECETT